MILSVPDGYPLFIKAKLDRPTWAEIDTSALKSNIRSLRRHVAPSARFLAVVKAEAYGHGALGVAGAALEEGAWGFGVATPYEGQLLRAARVETPIIILSPTFPQQAEDVLKNRLTPAVTSLETAAALSASAPGPQEIHVKVNTGMNRSGISCEEAPDFIRAVSALPNIIVAGVFSHFAGADDPDRHPAYDQFDRFEALLRRLGDAGLRPPIAHIANSAALIDMPETSLDMVRAGLAMYGMYPSSFVSRSVKLAPVLGWKTRIVETRRLAPGDAVSYSGTWIAPRPTTVALLPVGYADGYRRALSNRGAVLIGGRRCPVAGRVCMDLTVVDVGDAEVKPGDEAVLIGRQGTEEITADEMAGWIGTNNYEVTTQVSYRVPRRLKCDE